MFDHLAFLSAIFAAGLLTALWLRHNQRRARQNDRAFVDETRLDALPAAIWHTDAAGHCTSANIAWRKLADPAGEQHWRGLEWVRAFDDPEGEPIRQQWISAISRQQFFEADWRISLANAAPLWLMTRAAPQFSEDGVLLGYRCVSIDVTRAKLRERELIDLAQAADLAHAETGRLFGDIGHEIRPPLAAMVELTDLLACRKFSADQQADLPLIASSGRAILRLIDDSIAIASGDPEALAKVPEPVNIAELLRQWTDLLTPLARIKGVKVGLWTDDAIPECVEIDQRRMRQVICHLVSNAIAHTDNGGVDIEARVESTSDGQHLLLSVIDSGIGIAPDQLRAILQPVAAPEPFASPTKRQRGLAIINHLTHEMGGTLVAHSKQDVGSNFTVRLPLREHSGTLDSERSFSTAGQTAPELLKGARILLVEDDELTRHLMLALLARLGLKVATAECSDDALAAIKHAKANAAAFDAVLMDINLPGVDGLETARRLRANGTLARELPVIALTARSSPADIAACAEAGMQAHIAKPFTSVALARELARCLVAGRANADETGGQDTRPAKLEKRYFDRKGALLKSLRSSLDRDPARTDWQALAGELHGLARAASQFGEIQLGEASRRLEARLSQSIEPQACHKHLRQAWPELQRVA